MKLVLAFLTLMTFKAQALTDSILCNGSADNKIEFSNQILTRTTDEITLLIWNAHKFGDAKYLSDLEDLSVTSDIMMLQEAVHSTAWQKAFSSRMAFSYSFFKSFCEPDRQATGVMTAARFPLQDNLTIVSEINEPVTETPKVSGYSTVTINGQLVHLINTHALNFNNNTAFESQISALVYFISQLQGPLIWAGDFNTWNQARKKYLAAQTASLGLQELIPANDFRKLALDHVFVRGFSVIKTEIFKRKTSDHNPIQATLKLL